MMKYNLILASDRKSSESSKKEAPLNAIIMPEGFEDIKNCNHVIDSRSDYQVASKIT